ncbi:MAG: methyltransferase domain-containing protein [Alphaproteobacteria bacterium]|nr:MAG: methyltransferase domain-containing protein [Alphaproteobacteria bacterium]
MTPSARITAIIDILKEFETFARPIDRICDAYFRARRFIGGGDRRFISDLVYKIMRHKRKLDWWIGQGGFGLMPNARTNALAALVFLERWNMDQIAGAFTDDKYASGALNEVEQKWVGRWAKSPPQILSADMDDATKLECPAWLLPKIQEYWPNWQELLTVMQTEASVDLRVNSLRGLRDEVFAQILGALPEVEKTPYSPLGLRLKQRANLGNLEQLKDGTIEVQDEGSQLIALLCAARPGMSVLDYCAGAGGKTLALAAEMQNKGRVTACDNHDARLKKSVQRFRRAGVHNHELKLLDKDGEKWLSRQHGRFDRVLCDVPCSGTGTWRRNPDMRHRFSEKDLAELIEVQQNILNQTAPLVKSGGWLIYSTCSILREENDAQIERFLAAHPEFALADISEPLWAWKLAPDKGFLRLNPADHATDGFFAAVLIKVGK